MSYLKIGPRKLKEVVIRGRLPICVIGLDDVGLSEACLFCEKGATVIGTDPDRRTVRFVKRGKAPFDEPGLQELVRTQVKSGRLRATSKIEEAARESLVLTVHLDVPIDHNREPDYTALKTVSKSIGMSLRPYTLIVVEGAVAPGATEEIVMKNIEKYSGLIAGKEFGLAYSPARVSKGTLLRDLALYPRLVGGYDRKSFLMAKSILSLVTESGVIEARDIKTAEIARLFENAYQDVNIALVNQLAIFCEKYGVDYSRVQRCVNARARGFLHHPGQVGGRVPTDSHLLLSEAREFKVDLRLIELARKVNEAMLWHAISLVSRALRQSGKKLTGSRILVLGVSYKPDVKRENGSRIRELVTELTKRGATICVYDPLFSQKELESLGYPTREDLGEAARGADCIVVAVGHKGFGQMKLGILKRFTKEMPIIVDLGRLIDPEKARNAGFLYYGIGLPPS